MNIRSPVGLLLGLLFFCVPFTAGGHTLSDDCTDLLTGTGPSGFGVLDRLGLLDRSVDLRQEKLIFESPFPELARYDSKRIAKRVEILIKSRDQRTDKEIVDLEIALLYSELLLRFGVKTAIFIKSKWWDLSGLVIEVLGSIQGHSRLDRILKSIDEKFGTKLLISVKHIIDPPEFNGFALGTNISLNPLLLLSYGSSVLEKPPRTLLHEIQHISHLKKPRFQYLNTWISNRDVELPDGYQKGFVVGELETWLTDAHYILQQLRTNPSAIDRMRFYNSVVNLVMFHRAIEDVMENLSDDTEVLKTKNDDGVPIYSMYVKKKSLKVYDYHRNYAFFWPWSARRITSKTIKQIDSHYKSREKAILRLVDHAKRWIDLSPDKTSPPREDSSIHLLTDKDYNEVVRVHINRPEITKGLRLNTIRIPPLLFNSFDNLITDVLAQPSFKEALEILRKAMLDAAIIQHYPTLKLRYFSSDPPELILQNGIRKSANREGVHAFGSEKAGWNLETKGKHQYLITYNDAYVIHKGNIFAEAFIEVYRVLRHKWGLPVEDQNESMVDWIYSDLGILAAAFPKNIFIKTDHILAEKITYLGKN